MKAFEYVAPRTEAEVLSLLSERRGHTEILAGGTDLVGLMKQMLITPERVVYIDQVDSLKIIERDPDTGGIIIGACAHLDELLEHALLTEYPAVTQAIRGINSMQLQAQGTIGGELCRRPRCWYFRSGNGLLADRGRMIEAGDNQFHAILGNSGPAKYVHASRIAPALLALGATLRVAGPAESDENLVLADDFFRIARHDEERETVLGPDQLLTHILLPPAHGLSNATYEVRQSEGPDMPLAAAAASLVIAGGIVREAKIVLGQVAPVPWVSTDAARSIVGRPVTEESARAAGAAAVAAATPLSHNAYKVQLTQTAVTRAILLAAGAEPTWL